MTDRQTDRHAKTDRLPLLQHTQQRLQQPTRHPTLANSIPPPPSDPGQSIRFVTLERISASGSGPGAVGLTLSKTDISDPYVVDNIEPDVRGGGCGGRESWTERRG